MIRTKQINMPELYEALDSRYKVLDVSIPSAWSKEENEIYYKQNVAINGATITSDSKVVIQTRFDLSKTVEENAENEALFTHIVKATQNDDNTITFYSETAMESALNVSILVLVFE